ncbi:hypothetical protein CPB83DRAFT_893940 [Crepidotus variabilis]|uniref:Uncharacterized protein n=1 Tax=Crepidotus variabilis TaxID=179855 RepID=A0A9P6JQX5_9AGAR|nr:hypothetical protein CPB83DRAFT_893940 [Crepidotus variabilis]
MALNTVDPLLYIPVDREGKMVVYHYVLVGTLAVLFFDLLDSSIEDYTLFTQKRWTLITLLYATSRSSTVAFVLLDVLSQLALPGKCQFWRMSSTVFFILAHTSTSAIFLVRASVVYNEVRRAIAFFAVAWVVAACSFIVTLSKTTSKHLGPSHFCLTSINEQYMMVAIFVQCAYDTLLCGAITYKLAVESRDTSTPGKWRPWRLPVTMNFHRLEQRFLQDSQTFYLLTICFKIPEIIIYFVLAATHGVPSAPVMVIMAFPDTAITSIIAGRVYRKMKLGRPGLMEGAITMETLDLDRLSVTSITTGSQPV